MRRRAILISCTVVVIGLMAYVASAYVQGDGPFARGRCKASAVEVTAVDMVNGAAAQSAQCCAGASGGAALACGDDCSGCPMMVPAAAAGQGCTGHAQNAACTHDCTACPATRDGTCPGAKGGVCRGGVAPAGQQAVSCQGGVCPAASAVTTGCPTKAQAKQTACGTTCPLSSK